MKETDIAWLAGLLEGEGCFTFCGGSTHRSARIILNMSDLDIVKRAKRLMGSKDVIYRSVVGRPGKQMYCIETTKAEKVYEILSFIYPYMGVRRKARIDELLAHVEGVLKRRANQKQKCLLIRHLYDTGKFTRKALAEMAGVHPATVWNYTTRRVFKEI